MSCLLLSFLLSFLSLSLFLRQRISDSSRAFKALILAMIELKQCAICRLIPRRGVVARFVALVPQPEKADEQGGIIQPAGMWMVFLPFADDIRKLKFEPTPIADDRLKLAAKKVVDKLTLPELPTIPNPALQKHYAVIQAVALQERLPEQVSAIESEQRESPCSYVHLHNTRNLNSHLLDLLHLFDSHLYVDLFFIYLVFSFLFCFLARWKIYCSQMKLVCRNTIIC